MWAEKQDKPNIYCMCVIQRCPVTEWYKHVNAVCVVCRGQFMSVCLWRFQQRTTCDILMFSWHICAQWSEVCQSTTWIGQDSLLYICLSVFVCSSCIPSCVCLVCVCLQADFESRVSFYMHVFIHSLFSSFFRSLVRSLFLSFIFKIVIQMFLFIHVFAYLYHSATGHRWVSCTCFDLASTYWLRQETTSQIFITNVRQQLIWFI